MTVSFDGVSRPTRLVHGARDRSSLFRSRSQSALRRGWLMPDDRGRSSECILTALMAQADADKDFDWAVGGHHNRAGPPARGRSPQKGAPAGGLTTSSTSLLMPAAGAWRSSSPDRRSTHRPSPMSWPPCVFPDDAVNRVPDRLWS